jgi:hypothetical protein
MRKRPQDEPTTTPPNPPRGIDDFGAWPKYGTQPFAQRKPASWLIAVMLATTALVIAVIWLASVVMVD